MITMNASEFKAKCLSILDEVERTGQVITVLKRGKPIAQVVPVVPREKGYAQQTLKGTVKILKDVIPPVLPSQEWEAEGK
jgi:prevent-host-death family protein